VSRLAASRLKAWASRAFTPRQVRLQKCQARCAQAQAPGGLGATAIRNGDRTVASKFSGRLVRLGVAINSLGASKRRVAPAPDVSCPAALPVRRLRTRPSLAGWAFVHRAWSRGGWAWPSAAPQRAQPWREPGRAQPQRLGAASSHRGRWTRGGIAQLIESHKAGTPRRRQRLVQGFVQPERGTGEGQAVIQGIRRRRDDAKRDTPATSAPQRIPAWRRRAQFQRQSVSLRFGSSSLGLLLRALALHGGLFLGSPLDGSLMNPFPVSRQRAPEPGG